MPGRKSSGSGRGNLFFALALPAPLARELAATRALWDERERQAWRWVAPELFHLTLVFLGPLEESRVGALHLAGARAASARGPFLLQARGLGAFPSSRQPTRVLWAGLLPSPPLQGLVQSLEEALRDEGFVLDGKTFQAHITLARRRRDGQRSVFPLSEGWLGKVWGEWPVEELVLLQSRLGAGPPLYQKRGLWRLSGDV